MFSYFCILYCFLYCFLYCYYHIYDGYFANKIAVAVLYDCHYHSIKVVLVNINNIMMTLVITLAYHDYYMVILLRLSGSLPPSLPKSQIINFPSTTQIFF